ncbi:MAG: zf-HC2 domain-containing protein [Thermoanaerobaculia bacterium]
MTDCREFELWIDRAHAGELDENERELLLAHLETCTACSDLFDLLGRVRAEGEVPEPAADRFAAMRRAVVAELARPAVVPFPAPTPAPSGWRLSPALAAGLAFLLLAAGWLLGSRGVPRAAERSAAVSDPSSAAGPASAAVDRRLTGEIRTAAVRNTRFEDVENSPFVYSNVAVEELAGARVRLSFDVARHLDLELAKSDPLVTEVLVQSLVGSSSVGTRIRAVGLAGDRDLAMDPKVEQALLVAMRSDENLGVRLLAQSRLAERAGDPDVRAAMLAILENEPSVQMRLAAIDYLTRDRVQPDELERAIGRGPSEGDSALYQSARSYIQRSDS